MPLPDGVELTWYGHATFLMQTPGGKRVLFDPWFDPNPACPDDADPGAVDIMLLSHGHDDHIGSAVEIAKAKQPEAVVAIVELCAYLSGQGVENLSPGNKGGTQDVGGIKVTFVHADHSSSTVDEDGRPIYLGEPCGLMIELESGSTVYYAGDTAVFGDMRLLGELYRPDVAILPIGDHFTMGPREAAKAVELLGVTCVVPMHYGTFPLLTGTPEKVAELCGVKGLELLTAEPGGTVGVTFSLVAHDPAAGQWGVAVASKFLAVGSVVPWVRAGVGAVATQALANVSYGPRGLSLLEAGAGAEEAVARLTAEDSQRAQRQLGIVDRDGGAATFTGDECLPWAGGRAAPGVSAQGNILAGLQVVDAMLDTFDAARGRLAERLLAALAAGDAAGGDRRGRQSAALLVHEPRGGYGGTADAVVDLRVDDHPDPVGELRRLVVIHDDLFGSTPEEELLPLEGGLAAEVGRRLGVLGYDAEGRLEPALAAWAGVENLEERMAGGTRIDPVVLRVLRARTGG